MIYAKDIPFNCIDKTEAKRVVLAMHEGALEYAVLETKEGSFRAIVICTDEKVTLRDEAHTSLKKAIGVVAECLTIEYEGAN